MGRVGFRSGYVNADNIKHGDIQFTALQQTLSVSYDEPFRENTKDYAVLFTNREDPDANSNVSDPFVNTRSETGFTAERTATGNAQDVSWLAIDQDVPYRT